MNLFELFVKVGIKDEASSKLGTLTSKLGNGLKTAAKVGVAAVSAASAGIVALTKQAVESYAEFEQLSGGAELMFGDAYNYVMERSQEAYKNVQMSQNEYLQQVNGFATGLKTALGGNEQAAAELADKIITAEADIIAATGNTQENVQNAFNGIMRSNFTMLDNLQIGITPTKEGFQEVIDKVNEWNETNGKATDYQMGNLADMQSALVDYIDMVGYAGYAHDEAQNTISGSIATTKSAWSNLVTGLANDNANIDKLIGNFVESVGNTFTQILPKVKTALSGAGQLVGKIVPQIIEEIPSLINENLPVILESALGIIEALVSGLSDNSEMLADSAILVLTTLATALLENLPELITATVELIAALANGLSEQLPTLLPVALDAVLTIVGALIENTPLLLEAGISLILGLIEGILSCLELLAETAKETFDKFKDTIKEKLSEMVEQGRNAVSEFISGIRNKFSELVQTGTEVFQKVRDAVKNKVSEISTQGKDLITNFVSGVKSLFSRLTSAGSEIISTVKSAISSRVSEFFSIGSNIVEGVWQGIQNAIGWFTSSVSSFFSGIVDDVKSTLGIASPSKVFAQIGRFMAEGLGIGWDSEIGNIQKDIEDSLDFGDGYIGTYGLDTGVIGGSASGGNIINITQNIYAKEQSAAELMREARWQAKMGVALGV